MSFLVERGRGKGKGLVDLIPGWLVMPGVWALVGALLVLIDYLQSAGTGNLFPFPWWVSLRWNLVQSYIWWALSPLIVLLVRRFPFEPGRRLRSLPVYVASIILFPLAWAAIFASIYRVLEGPLIRSDSFGTFLRAITFGRFQASALAFIAIVAIIHAVDYYRKCRERELQLAQARLHSLKAQLHPHFLFNALNAVSELVHKDPEAAERTIIDLSDLLRCALDSRDAHLITLQEELDFLRKYVDIHRVLMQDRLTVVIKADAETLGASVPSMILQPLVENAVRHGVDPASRAGRIEVSAARDCGALRLTVSDAGPGLPEDGHEISRKGIGLANTQARLAELYGSSHRFELKNSPGPGLTVNIFIPFEERDEGRGRMLAL